MIVLYSAISASHFHVLFVRHRDANCPGEHCAQTSARSSGGRSARVFSPSSVLYWYAYLRETPVCKVSAVDTRCWTALPQPTLYLRRREWRSRHVSHGHVTDASRTYLKPQFLFPLPHSFLLPLSTLLTQVLISTLECPHHSSHPIALPALICATR
jgi:hypothetical protein